ncbi:MAG: glycosyltransferase, partial [Candidatus Rokuibacteriota bacterium]
MAMGKTVVASRAGGPPEIITHEQNGLLVPPHEEEPLGAAIIRLLTEPGFAAQIAACGQQEARRRFSLTAHVDAMQEIYAELIGGGGTPRAVAAVAPEGRS